MSKRLTGVEHSSPAVCVGLIGLLPSNLVTSTFIPKGTQNVPGWGSFNPTSTPARAR
jgi:hypothetical protein